MSEQDAYLEKWMSDNDERLSRLWQEHLSYMQDSAEHIAYLANSDQCFKEFCVDVYNEERGPSDVL